MPLAVMPLENSPSDAGRQIDKYPVIKIDSWQIGRDGFPFLIDVVAFGGNVVIVTDQNK